MSSLLVLPSKKQRSLLVGFTDGNLCLIEGENMVLLPHMHDDTISSMVTFPMESTDFVVYTGSNKIHCWKFFQDAKFLFASTSEESIEDN